MFKRLIFVVLLCWIGVSAASETFEAGKDYEVISNAKSAKNSSPVRVVEFFSYGCPACFSFESTLEYWLKTKPAKVQFARVPVVFHEGWENYAKAYYMMKTLNREQTLSPKMFSAIHEQNQSLADQSGLAQFFKQQGVNSAEFEKLFNSEKINADVAHAQSSLDTYQIDSVPTVVVNGTYKLNMSMVHGDRSKFIQVLNYLIKKEQAS
ncbi:MAG: thiol:disulfide interchange protein DsbA/DsbL [Proteobacteria bacterium]|nr:thiol:disulfide interchange protein DsbA/DsbL [Pseudomonadota bacterium]